MAEASRTAPAFTRLLPFALPVVLLAAAVIGFVVAQRSVDDQEERLLRERTAEVTLVLSNAAASIPSGLRPLGVAARLGDDPERAFLAEARAIAAAIPNPDLALVRLQGGAPVVTASVGTAPPRGTRLDGQRAQVVRQALRDPQLAATPVYRDGNRRMLGFALGPPATPAGTVVLQQAPINPRATAVGQDDAFHELEAVVYATPQARRDQIIVATTEEMPTGDDVGRGRVPVGTGTWLLLTSPRESLAGSGATALPWFILGAGLLGALLAAGVIAALLRRRDYALSLVEARTAELRDSLDRLQDAQSQLVLQERQAAVGRVAAVVGHELRAPLGDLTAALARVRARVTGPEREAVGDDLDAAERDVASAAGIVESLLDYAREREPAATSVDLADILDEALSASPPPDGVTVERRFAPMRPMHADRRLLRQVVLNLLANGYEAMGDGGTLTVEATPNGRDVELRIADTGMGMDAATEARAFEPFYTTKDGAIGLGLPVARRIAEMHGGSLRTEAADGRGTTLVLTVPLEKG